MYGEMVKSTLIILFIVLGISSANAGKLDSLRNELNNATGLKKIEVLYALSATYEHLDPIERNQFAERGYELALKSQNDSLIAVGLKNIAIGKYYLQDFESTTYYFQAALEQYRENKDTFGISVCLGNLGMLYKRNIQYDIAIDYMLEARELKRIKKDSIGLTSITYNLVSLYYELNDTYKALEYNKLVENLNKTVSNIPKDYSPDLWLNYGAIYLRLAQNQISSLFHEGESVLLQDFKYNLNDSSIYYIQRSEENYKKALKHFRKINDEMKIATILKGIGNLNMTKRDFENAFKAQYEALDLFKKANNIREMGRMYINIAFTYAFADDYENSLKYYTIADSLAEEFQLIDVSERANTALYNFYLIREDKAKAFDYLKKLYVLKDSANSLNISHRLNKLRAQETIKNKNYKIQILEKDKELFARERIILVISVSITMLLAILWYARFRYKSKTNNLLEKKNTQLEQLNLKLQESQQQLTEINIAKDKMFAIIAHDLRNPIGSFRQSAELLYSEFDSLSDEDKKDFSEGLKDSSQKVYNLMENLLTWSRSQRGKIECFPVETNLFRLVENTKDNLCHQADNKNITINNLIQNDLEAYIDPQLTSTIMRNLLSNAIKFSHKDSSILIDSKINDKNVEIAVRDQGIGMDSKQISRLFDLDSSNSTIGTDGEEGTGLGLLLCKEFAELQKGSLHVESKIGIGSTFTISLPFK